MAQHAAHSTQHFPTFGNASLRGLARLRNAKRRRASSWDRTGGNRDFISIVPGETATLAEITGAGCITHLWFTVASDDPLALRNLSLRMYWDGEDAPSVQTPVGDFFGIGPRTNAQLCHADARYVPARGARPELLLPHAVCVRRTHHDHERRPRCLSLVLFLRGL